MPGEVWRSAAGAAKETVYGTYVAPTRLLYPLELSIANEREGRPKRMAVGKRDNVRGFTSGPDVVGGTARIDMSADEIDEWLSITLQGNVTPTTPAGGTLAKQRVYTPGGTTLDSMSLLYNDGAANWQATGLYGNQITFEGSAAGESTVSVELFGKSRAAGGALPALTERTPTFLEGWQAVSFIDGFGATPGTTAVVALTAWTVTIANNLDRKYLADNDKLANAIPIGVLDATAQLTFEAAVPATQTELGFWDADTPRLVRLAFLGPANGIETGQRATVMIDVAGHWMSPDFTGEDAGTRTYQMTLQYRYDATNAFGCRVTTINGRAATWAAT